MFTFILLFFVLSSDRFLSVLLSVLFISLSFLFLLLDLLCSCVPFVSVLFSFASLSSLYFVHPSSAGSLPQVFSLLYPMHFCSLCLLLFINFFSDLCYFLFRSIIFFFSFPSAFHTILCASHVPFLLCMCVFLIDSINRLYFVCQLH